MIKIKQNNQKWRIEIQEEEWQFESREEFESALKTLLDLKEINGQLPKRRDD